MSFWDCCTRRTQQENLDVAVSTPESSVLQEDEEFNLNRSSTCKKVSTVFLALALAGFFIALGATAILTWPIAIGCAVGICVALAVLYGISQSCCCNKDSNTHPQLYSLGLNTVTGQPAGYMQPETGYMQQEAGYMQPV